MSTDIIDDGFIKEVLGGGKTGGGGKRDGGLNGNEVSFFE